VVLAVVGSVSGQIAPSALWPHHWPVPLQAVFMLLAADFLRYWLHRLVHENAFLWRFHAVHHSPHKLYWLNVGRFHPVDKALQFLLDALPFMLLGVSEPVISLYFVFYAVNGFFQHSNVHMRFGLLNYVISSAELHRWHHSRVPAESNTNYGNNLIVWDLLFGTRFLPRDREIHDLGLKNKRYPMAFMAQMRAPLTPSLPDRDVSLYGFRNSLINLFLHARMKFIEGRYWQPLLKATHEPRREQMNVLHDILRHNRSTRYGQDHGFSDISDYTAFCRQVPVNNHEALRSYIEEQEKSGTPALINDDVVMYAVTSGTTADPKLLPISERMLEDYRRNQAIFSCLQYRHRPAAFHGRYLGIVGGAVEGTTEKGTPCGSISGVLNRRMPRIAQQKYTTPPEIFELKDYDLKYYLILRLALMHRNLSYIVCANPSTLLKLESLINAELDSFVEEIERGSLRALPALGELPGELRRELTVLTRPHPRRARELRALLGQVPEVRLQDAWPELGMITTWKGGSCSIALKALEGSISEDTALVDLGYLSSEFRGTFTYDHATGAGIPSLQDNFFEFATVAEWDAGTQHFLTLEQLAAGEDYYIFVTTRGGLYRYDMNDIVRVEGFLNRTPLLRFLQKGRGVTSITGEKLYENQVIEAVGATLQAAGTGSPFYLMTADRARSGYRLYLETDSLAPPGLDEFARSLEQQLYRVNMEYHAKRESGRLAPLEVRLLQPGAGEHYKAACIRTGQKEGQFKTVALQYRDELVFDFDERLK
ncbi:MAG: GH3 auxin-responsive promoter family protein, partial [Pseudomonadota bacterium]